MALSAITLTGALQKMQASVAPAEAQVQYLIQLSDSQALHAQSTDAHSPSEQHSCVLNPYIGGSVQIDWTGRILCQNCQRRSRKSYGQGYCYPCFSRLAQCDTCMMAPERCHYHLGTCRDNDWAEQVCFQSHCVYLSNTSGLKVGITRSTQRPVRWLDQGATQAIPLLYVTNRHLSGLVESHLKQEMSDRTNWRQMLKGTPETLDLAAIRSDLKRDHGAALQALAEPYGAQAVCWSDEDMYGFDYPVLSYPTKVSSFNLDKTAQICGRLMGIKGQYLLLDGGVINLRRFSGYEVSLKLQPPATEY